uniref:Annexin n=1 Tax=Salarias fasciatus TaxID=181472 RepID=A0A672GZ09_SALFA
VCVFQSVHRGTVQPKADFDAGEDAAALKEAIEGIGTDEKVLVDILTRRSGAQRQLICEAYQEAAGRSLLEDLKGDTDDDFQHVLVALVTPLAAFDCHEVMRAMKGLGTEDSTLIEIFASRSNQQVKALSDVYLQGESQQSAMSKEQTQVLQSHDQAHLSMSVSLKLCLAVQTLYHAGEKKWGTDEAPFIDILCKRSVAQLRQTLVAYKNLSGKTLQRSIEGEMSGNLEELLVAVVKCVKNIPAYFAERLHDSMKGGGTDERTLTRIMVGRSEIDLLDIRAEFKKLYECSLLSAIQSDASGDYGECLKIICGGDD